MKRWFHTGLVIVLGFALDGAPTWGQVVERERDVSITGPRGRTIDRSITTERGPGFVDRQVNIQRPGGTFSSNSMIQRAPSVVRGGGGFAPVGRFGGWGPRPFIGREVIINNGGGPGAWLAPLAVGLGSFGVGMFAGSALASSPPPPPQPVYAVPPPGYVLQPAPGAAYNPPQPYGPAQPPQPPQTPVVDPLAEAVTRLQSHHANSRRDGAYTLGRLRDPRAIPALIDRLKNDSDVDVRVAAATAMGEIGDPRAAVYLERVTIYDKKQKVRDAAALALTHLPRESVSTASMPVTPAPAPPQPGVSPIPSNMMPLPSARAALPSTAPPLEPEPIERVPPPPTPSTTTSGPGFPLNP